MSDATGPRRDIGEEEGRLDLFSYELVRSDFFTTLKDPVLTFNGKRVYVNAAAVRLFPEVEYMEILFNRQTKSVVFHPTDATNKEGYRWAREKGGKRYATSRTGPPFVIGACQVMGWDPNLRYTIKGHKARTTNNEEVLEFLLVNGHGNERRGKGSNTGRSMILTGWDGSFGPKFGSNRESMINTFDGYTVFSVGRRKKEVEAEHGHSETSD